MVADILQGRRILVVEDESLVAMLLETMLEDMGCQTVGPFATVAAALDAVRGGAAIDAALLDVNVAGEAVFPVAEALRAAGVPVVFSTGYGESGLSDDWRGALALQKPFTEAAVAEALAKALAPSR